MTTRVRSVPSAIKRVRPPLRRPQPQHQVGATGLPHHSLSGLRPIRATSSEGDTDKAGVEEEFEEVPAGTLDALLPQDWDDDDWPEDDDMGQPPGVFVAGASDEEWNAAAAQGDVVAPADLDTPHKPGTLGYRLAQQNAQAEQERKIKEEAYLEAMEEIEEFELRAAEDKLERERQDRLRAEKDGARLVLQKEARRKAEEEAMRRAQEAIQRLRLDLPANSTGASVNAPSLAGEEDGKSTQVFYSTSWSECTLGFKTTLDSDWKDSPFQDVPNFKGWKIASVDEASGFHFVVKNVKRKKKGHAAVRVRTDPPAESRRQYSITETGTFTLRDGELQRVQDPPILIIIDIDQVLLNDQDDAENRIRDDFNDIWLQRYAFGGSRLVYFTKRDKQDALMAAGARRLLRPDILICGPSLSVYAVSHSLPALLWQSEDRIHLDTMWSSDDAGERMALRYVMANSSFAPGHTLLCVGSMGDYAGGLHSCEGKSIVDALNDFQPL